ncbi:TolC family protein [Undibacterium oligocarboniphilum]|uniref:TolC family protein n=1 Tax=Undibacterium oligocarboniphilum TaxID=666702 RepID=A0A850QIJ5_9BURK|nr:TolC family protein [Undibacterium oligocarboniphilum]MBC3868610.1 TolC family protein [Undibacterium oligocarboniphilum]NVO76590.1 TolC family protein [Undibacterium oligocarboniphilum]
MYRPLQYSLCVLTLSLLSTQVRADTSLHEALDKAWDRAVQARVAESRQSEAQASRAVADSWLAEPPSIGVSEKNDRFNDRLGVREREFDLVLPLLLPGQRAAREAFALRDAADAKAMLPAARLVLAGELRTAVWNVAATRADTRIAVERLSTAGKLEADVRRRQQAGELARTDLLLAQEETFAAKNALAETQTRERQALARLHLLTGLDDIPDAVDESMLLPAPAHHPRIALAETAMERARADMQMIREDRRNPPELSVGVVQTRDAYATPAYSTLRVGIRIPFGSEARNAPKLATANSAWVKAEAELRQTTAEIAAEQGEAQVALDNAESISQIAQTRAALADERLALQEKAFSLGELSLTEFMRVRASVNEVRLELLRAKVALGAARAQLNQAKGILP